MTNDSDQETVVLRILDSKAIYVVRDARLKDYSHVHEQT
jgi:hypothetical protein